MKREAAGIEPANHSPGFRIGARVLVETTSEWVPATCIGFRAGDVEEDFERVDVLLEDGRRWLGCHPQHVRELP
ncbi:MAG: hypothetical protein M3364_09730 [Actinomycetota bacterium]|nr:hypothetical protein [Actinomycetota bacterium]